ncbi:DUF3823 domain-containing protein [Arcticibacter tournemirensis]|uniref:DUF3823 domain-containing protein n=1 Tax=Arcticibacter tournemirensis TaxID=699437 RepID=A0A4Q0MG09_9SPHI|nr:DUF3823 domain-containing protein [Arcticibacter tournemirensis]RXF72447.1 DUF3823 domain-containing protein [Arcticibacter tournemirensis]
MKKEFNYILAGLLMAFASCAKDNYDAPSSTFQGRITYQGEPVNVEEGQVRFQLWEGGWGKLTAIDVAVKQDGGFSALLFDADYKLVFPSGQGPFMTVSNGAAKDTTNFTLRGNQIMDIEVIPYYMVRDAQFRHTSGNITAHFRIDKIITNANARDIERVTLYVNKTQFVSGGTQIANTDLAISPSIDWTNLNMSVAVPALVPAQNYVYARVGVKIAGIEDLVFSPVMKVDF